MKNHDMNLEIKKIILSQLQGPENSISDVIKIILDELMLLPVPTPKPTLQLASEYIVAYLQLGFSYLEHQTLFDEILQEAGFSAKEIASLQLQNPMVELTKTKLRSIIGRWAASSYNSHTITAAIDEIIFHVEKDEPGFYQYYTAKKDGSYTALYQLTVTSSYALFHDVFKNKFYRLVKK